ncbi:DUF6992 family protein [Williamsia sp. M5A3_1d]
MDIDRAPEVSRRLARRLAVWGGVSTVAGGALAVAGPSARARAFGLQNAMWGAIDVAIAAISTRQSTPPNSPKLRRLLFVNTGLDVGYVAGGAHLLARTPSFGGRITPEQARGHGAAVIVQGAALFVLDLTHAVALTRE